VEIAIPTGRSDRGKKEVGFFLNTVYPIKNLAVCVMLVTDKGSGGVGGTGRGE